jgi:hypothetical protein
MSNRFYYGMPGTQAFQAMNALDDDVQVKSAAATTAAQAAASSAAQAGSARDAALAAWLASTAPNEQLAALSKQFHSDTVVDVFLYDTSGDSDGGAWRKRCKHTSWENEALQSGKWLGQFASVPAAVAFGGRTFDYFQNTTDGLFYQIQSDTAGQRVSRGNTREFPAVGLIVVEAQRLVIYDATHPELPMWMAFSGDVGAALLYGPATLTSAAMRDGLLLVGNANDTFAGLVAVNFVSEGCNVFRANGRNQFKGTIAQRNNSADFLYGLNGPALVNHKVNDVAITVLADASIDPSTGMPTATVAIATQGGVSVIRQDGTVANITNGSNDSVDKIGFGSDDTMWVGQSNNATWGSVSVGSIPPTSTSLNSWRTKQYYPTATPATLGYLLNALVPSRASGSGDGVTLYRDNPCSPAKGMVAYIANTYNSGWQVGDSRGAWLADTVVESIGASGELVSNGTFNTNTSGWTPTASATPSVVNGAMRLTNASGGYVRSTYVVSTVPGRTYVVSVTVVGMTTSSALAFVGTTSGGLDGGLASPASLSGPGTIAFSFTASTTTSYLTVGSGSGQSAGQYADFDNVSVKLAEPDRSMKTMGLLINGSLTKSAVATGAQLVSYSGFSAASYLEQPYNANLNFGTGDFCVMTWVKRSGAMDTLPFTRTDPGMSGAFIQLLVTSAGVANIATGLSGGASLTQAASATGAVPDGMWAHVVGLRSGGQLYLYVNGLLAAGPIASSHNVTGTTATTRVGTRQDGYTAPGSVALLRVSATAPSADQIAQIYRDELQLFRPGAQCTFDGASTTVTSMAYDDMTEILHVGTSWGRSSFHGLQRVDSAATPVGAVTALSAASGAHITGGIGGARYQQPALVLRDELRRNDVRGLGARDVVPFDFDSTAGTTDFTLPPGWSVRDVLVAGVMKRVGATKDYVVSFDGYRDTVRFAASPGAAWVQVMASRSDPG